MQVQIDIEFNQLLKIVKTLKNGQLKQLKCVIDQDVKKEHSKIDLESILLNGPVATEKQLDIISSNRKSINQWRTKQ